MSREERLKSLYLEAAALPPERRAELLDRRCAVDGALREEVERLLAAEGVLDRFMDHPTSDVPARSERSTARGSMVGNYKILEQIGEGGFGAVYLAEQQRPVVRRVALKILREDLVGRDVIARFEAERQALALMDHPHIAKILDAGTAPSGQPYFVMDLVVGQPITRYCDEHRLTLDERLGVFEQVCQATQHAHTKGIMHRDLKPSNVLVSTRDGRPHATVIDFGIAKATQMRLTERTLFTAHQAFVGTPEYMSPEQADGSNDVDTRTDVYSLGIMLYELLTGSTPFGREALRGAGFAEVLRVIREVEPPRPSTRVAELPPAATGREAVQGDSGRAAGGAGRVPGPASGGATREKVAESRGSQPEALIRSIRGELDWIVMKAIDKDRSRRYATANALALDITRHLGGQPVSAAPPSAWYRAAKAFRRNRAVAVVSAAAVLALAGAAAVAVYGWAAAAERGRKLNDALAQQTLAAQRADQEAAAAEASQAQATAERQEALRARDAATREAYAANIRAAEMALAHHERRRLLESLAACPEPLRRWEWRYLTAAADSSLATIRGHRAEVFDAVYSPDGRMICTTSGDFSAKLWDAEDGRALRSLDEHAGDVVRVRFNSDGSRLLTLSSDGTARLWNTAAGTVLRTVLEADGPELTVAAWSPDDAFVAAGCADGTVRIVAVQSESGERKFAAHDGGITCIEYSRDGTRLLTAARDGTVRLWGPGGEGPVTSFGVHEEPVTAAAISPDGMRVASASTDGHVLVWDTGTGAPQFPLQVRDGPVRRLAFSPDGGLVACAAGSVVAVFDAGDGERLQTFRGHDDAVWSVAFSPDSRRIVSGSSDLTARTWDAGFRAEQRSFAEAGIKGGSAAISRDGRRAVLIRGKTIEVRDLSTGLLVGAFETPALTPAMATFTPDGEHLLVHADTEEADWTGRGVLLNAATGETVAGLRPVAEFLPREVTSGSGYHPAAFSPDGRRVAVPMVGWRAEVYDWSSGLRLFPLVGHNAAVNDVDFSPDGAMIVTTADDGEARLWRSGDGAPLSVLPGHEGPVLGAAFSPSGAAVATRGRDRTVRVWRAAKAELAGVISPGALPLAILAVSDDASLLLLSETNGRVRLWDVPRAEAVCEVAAPGTARFSLSRDGLRLLCTAEDGTVRLWSTETGQELLPLRGHDSASTFACFIADDTMILSSDGHGTLLWDTRPAGERAEALRRADEARRAVETQLRARLGRGESIEAVRADAARDASLSFEQRSAALALLTEEGLRRRADADHLDEQARTLLGAAGAGAGPASAAEALEHARRAHELEPKVSGRTVRYGVALYYAGRYEEAIEMLRLADEQRRQEQREGDPPEPPYVPEATAHAAMAHFRLGRVKEARASLEQLRHLVTTRHSHCDCAEYLRAAERLLNGDPPSAGG